MKLAIQIILCLVGLFAAYMIIMSLFGLAIQLVIIGAILAAIVSVCGWQYRRWQSRRLPSKRAVTKIERETEKAVRELERRANRS